MTNAYITIANGTLQRLIPCLLCGKNDMDFDQCPFMPYSKLNNLTELSANDVKFISVDRQKLDLSKIHTYGAVNSIFVKIQPDSTNIKMTPLVHTRGI